jgi:hypothetical protein
MPLIVVANSPDKIAALDGLERWKGEAPEAAGHLAPEDVLVDSMRGRVVDMDADPGELCETCRKVSGTAQTHPRPGR